MRDLRLLDAHRHVKAELERVGSLGGRNAGIFQIRSPVDRKWLNIIASSGMGWDHVSVSRFDRVPNWEEMCYLKDYFFHDHETVMQLHPPKAEYVNNHEFCLHLWRPTDVEIPKPPATMVGVAGLTPEDIKKMTPQQREAIVDQTLKSIEER